MKGTEGTEGIELRGAFTALATPFSSDESIDEESLRRLVRYQIDGGIAGLVACGTTGETPTLSGHERQRVAEIVIDEAGGRCPVIVGAGGNNTANVVAEAREMARIGASAILSVSPYYNRPSQAGLLRHFRTIADATDCPLILYNVPGRTGGNIEAETAHALAAHPNIVAIKEASGRIASFEALLLDAPPDFVVLSGDDPLTFPTMCLGARGVVSVAANLAPTRVQRLTETVAAGDLAGARALHFELTPLFRACFLDTNPVPVKAGLAMIGFGSARLRLPLVPTGEAVRDEMARCLTALGHDLTSAPSQNKAVSV